MMDAGFEVIYTGLRQTPEQVARIATEEDVDVIALSSLAGSHLPYCRKLKPLLEAAGLSDKLWLIGGNLPAADHDELRRLGFAGIFPTGSRLDAITDYVRRGGRVTIYNRNTPVAGLVPARSAAADEPGDRLAANAARLAREGIVRRGSGETVTALLTPPEGSSSGVLDALLEERSSGR